MENQFDISSFKHLLDVFEKIPKSQDGPTFMQICRYPRNRYEEICSRILQFYLNPKAEHNMGDLWLRALLDAVKGVYERHDLSVADIENDSNYIDCSQVEVEREVYAGSKRIDLVVKSRSFAVCIENKTGADVYNPLDIYKHYMEENFNDRHIYCIVLSLYPVGKTTKLRENDFVTVSYAELFAAVRRLLGEYVANAKSEYLTYMLDFMKTLSNMNGNISEQERKFFKENREQIDNLIGRYNNYKQVLWDELLATVAALCDKLGEKLNIKIDAYEGWLPSVGFVDGQYRIGLEGHYKEENGNQYAKFVYFIKTWDERSWEHYNDKVFAKFNCGTDFRTDRNMRIYHLGEIDGGDMDKVVEELAKAYNDLKAVVEDK